MSAELNNAARRYQIGDLVLDTRSRTVTRGEENLRVRGLTFEMLLALAESAPSMVTYDELIDRVWKGREASPETIAQRAKILRAAISDEANSPRYFELVRGQGYRMVVEVSAPIKVDQRRARRWGGIVAAALALLVVVWATSDTWQDREVAPSVAVLPFEDLSETGDQQYLADGISEELISELTTLAGLDVASRTESFFYRGPTNDLEEIGKQLQVATILEGSVRKSGDSLRITVQLIEVKSGFHLWSQNFDSDTQDIFDIQESIATAVAGALGVKLGVGGVNEFEGAGTQNFAAYEAFLRRDFEKAIELDPNYAAAWSRNGVRIGSTMWGRMPEEAPAIIARARPYAAKAIALDPQSAQAYSDYAALVYASMDWSEAEHLFARAHQLNRSMENISSYGNMMLRAGRVEAAFELYEEADAMRRTPWPAKRVATTMRSIAHIALGNSDAAKLLSKEMHEQIALFNELTIALNFGSLEDVRAALQAIPQSTPDYMFLYGPVLQLLDQPARAIEYMTELNGDRSREWPHKYEAIATLAAYLGYPEFSLEVYSRDLQHTTIRYGGVWLPVMSEMRKLPKFKQLMTDVNLVDYWREYGWSDFCRPTSETDFVCH